MNSFSVEKEEKKEEKRKEFKEINKWLNFIMNNGKKIFFAVILVIFMIAIVLSLPFFR